MCTHIQSFFLSELIILVRLQEGEEVPSCSQVKDTFLIPGFGGFFFFFFFLFLSCSLSSKSWH